MEFQEYFKLAIERKASDLHLITGNKPSLRIDGELSAISDEVISEKFLEEALVNVLDAGRLREFHETKELDFSYEVLEHRFRINLHYQEGAIGLAARLIQSDAPKPGEVGFTDAIMNLTRLKDGLILVTGPSGVGKSTTLAAMVGVINSSRSSHIITIEDPIEYVFKDALSIVEQREVGSDTLSFANALKRVLRQDPNVIMIGEMRDTETIAAALTAAETGHLVLSTLHTNSAPEAIARIIDSFPSYRRQQVLSQLSMALRAVVAQQLLPKRGGGRVAVREIMINNPAVANLIRENKISQIVNVIKTSYQEGMIDMNKSIELLASQGVIDQKTAERYTRDMETRNTYY
jgi:twitching motility protein PilT